jgi:crotonobetainyl-CoA:carnitine CoA-transferase CaiB-like acyl-CoA transferase
MPESSDRQLATYPLRGVRVLDFTRILSGPYCSLLLRDMGADVIKVEKTGSGDDTRHWGPPFLDEARGISTYFAALNRGKRSFALDFRSPSAREILHALIPKVDVVLENFRPGVAQHLGLDHQSLAARNPRIVSCSISGFSSTGPYAGMPGTEIVVEGMSGLMDITGPPDGDPVRFGIAMVDIATGLTASTRIVASLLHARATGQGSQVDCSLYSTALGVLGTLITSYTATHEEPRRWGSHHPSICPYGGFPTADGNIITGAINDAMWPKLCEALELENLALRPEFQTNVGRVAHRAEVEAAIGDQCRSRPTDYWLERLRARGLLGSPIRTVGQAVEDPASTDLGLFVNIKGFPGVVSPRLDNVSHPDSQERVPTLGESTEEVLKELLQMTPPEVADLEARGVIQVSRGRDVSSATMAG